MNTILFLLCWISYFSTYIGRQNYSAVMAEIIASEGYLNQACGMVGTGFFICYGAGQLVSGFLGDRISPKWMIFTGLTGSAIANGIMSLLHSPQSMTIAWCINGLFQSMTWSPILRVFAEYLPAKEQKNACVNIATTYPAAVFLTYPLSSLMIYLWGWRSMFIFTCTFIGLVAVLWLCLFSFLEKKLEFQRQQNHKELLSESSTTSEKSSSHSIPVCLVIAIFFICGSLIVQVALRDGVTSWVPSYLSNTYHVGTSVAIFATTLLPAINLLGVYAANFIFRKWKKNEIQTSTILFAGSLIFLACLILTEGIHLVLSLIFFSLVTSCMMGINLMLVSFIPTNFLKWGRVSTVSGILNSTVYIGSSISTFGLGVVADLFGWSILIRFLCLFAAMGLVFCLCAIPGWKKFSSTLG